jgi:DNA-binding XRE family transcriptional regulator
MNHLSANLKKMRMHHGMTQAEAAERLGVQRSRYSGWENGMSEPNLDMLLACIHADEDERGHHAHQGPGPADKGGHQQAAEAVMGDVIHRDARGRTTRKKERPCTTDTVRHR